MKKGFIVVAALVFSLVFSLYVAGPAAAASPKPPATACFTFSYGPFVFNALVATKAASGNITMKTTKYKSYSVTGALSINGSDAVPVFGSGTVVTNTSGDNIFKFNISGTGINSSQSADVLNFNARGQWNLTDQTGTAHAILMNINDVAEFTGDLSMIPCDSFDFAP